MRPVRLVGLDRLRARLGRGGARTGHCVPAASRACGADADLVPALLAIPAGECVVMPAKRIKWTPAMLARLRWHAGQGHTMAEAAGDLGVSRGAVATQASNREIRFCGNCTPMPPPLTLAQEIAAARAEAPTAPPYRDPAAWPR